MRTLCGTGDSHIILFERSFWGEEFEDADDNLNDKFFFDFANKYRQLYNDDIDLYYNPYLDFF